ncbi:hypothetical protein FACS1894132_14420 [Clostridia bacterium]|nr:hypothetical protein FACS1894132_14420 [Clostridia bacterium]
MINENIYAAQTAANADYENASLTATTEGSSEKPILISILDGIKKTGGYLWSGLRLIITDKKPAPEVGTETGEVPEEEPVLVKKEEIVESVQPDVTTIDNQKIVKKAEEISSYKRPAPPIQQVQKVEPKKSKVSVQPAKPAPINYIPSVEYKFIRPNNYESTCDAIADAYRNGHILQLNMSSTPETIREPICEFIEDIKSSTDGGKFATAVVSKKNHIVLFYPWEIVEVRKISENSIKASEITTFAPLQLRYISSDEFNSSHRMMMNACIEKHMMFLFDFDESNTKEQNQKVETNMKNAFKAFSVVAENAGNPYKYEKVANEKVFLTVPKDLSVIKLGDISSSQSEKYTSKQRNYN